MHRSRREMVKLARPHSHPLQEADQVGGSRRRPHIVHSYSGKEPLVDERPRFGVKHVPRLGLGKPSLSGIGEALVRMDLHGQVLRGVEQLEEEREVTVGGRDGRAQHGGTRCGDETAEGLSPVDTARYRRPSPFGCG